MGPSLSWSPSLRCPPRRRSWSCCPRTRCLRPHHRPRRHPHLHHPPRSGAGVRNTPSPGGRPGGAPPALPFWPCPSAPPRLPPRSRPRCWTPRSPRHPRTSPRSHRRRPLRRHPLRRRPRPHPPQTPGRDRGVSGVCVTPLQAPRTPAPWEGLLTDLDCRVVRLDLGFGPRSLVMLLRFCRRGQRYRQRESPESQTHPITTPAPSATLPPDLRWRCILYRLHDLGETDSGGDRGGGEDATLTTAARGPGSGPSIRHCPFSPLPVALHLGSLQKNPGS